MGGVRRAGRQLAYFPVPVRTQKENSESVCGYFMAMSIASSPLRFHWDKLYTPQACVSSS